MKPEDHLPFLSAILVHKCVDAGYRYLTPDGQWITGTNWRTWGEGNSWRPPPPKRN